MHAPQSGGCNLEDKDTVCTGGMRDDSKDRRCGTGDRYCKKEYVTTSPETWVNVCWGSDFIRVAPGCGIEVARAGRAPSKRPRFVPDGGR